MRSAATVATFFLLTTTSLAQTVSVRYLANEGFLLEADGKKVLIDALFGKGLTGYPAVPSEIRSRLESAQGPFDDVDLILATHFHGDHFNAEAVAKHLRSNPRARFVSTPQALKRLRRELENEPGVLQRVESVYPPEGQAESLSRGGIQLQVLNLHHGRSRRPPVENLGFIIQLGHFKILHVGDTEATVADFKPYNLSGQRIDLALLPAWFLTYDRWVETVREEIQPFRIAVMHLALPSAPASFFGPDGSYASRIREMGQNFPEAVIFAQVNTSLEFDLFR